MQSHRSIVHRKMVKGFLFREAMIDCLHIRLIDVNFEACFRIGCKNCEEFGIIILCSIENMMITFRACPLPGTLFKLLQHLPPYSVRAVEFFEEVTGIGEYFFCVRVEFHTQVLMEYK